MTAPKGNKFAAKDDEERASSYLMIRVRPDDKARWVHAANGSKLSAWVVEMLNRAARRQVP